MLTATCHCGAVHVEVPRVPEQLISCNCSICRRYGTLWCYFPAGEVKLTGPVQTYAWGEKSIEFVRCEKCGTIMIWRNIVVRPDSRVGVNGRNFEPQVANAIRVRRLDGAADKWEAFLDE